MAGAGVTAGAGVAEAGVTTGAGVTGTGVTTGATGSGVTTGVAGVALAQENANAETTNNVASRSRGSLSFNFYHLLINKEL